MGGALFYIFLLSDFNWFLLDISFFCLYFGLYHVISSVPFLSSVQLFRSVQPAVSGPDKREIQSPHAFKAQKRDDTDNKQAHTQIGIASQMRTRKITKGARPKNQKNKTFEELFC